MPSSSAPWQSISVVIPVHDEVGNIGPLMAELDGVLGSRHERWEVVWVDDASVDGTNVELQSLLARYSSARALFLARQSGQSAAIWTGLHAVVGEVVVTMDGDGQNDPV